ncbi:hypothetical protein LTR15_009019 [Elasticomyces elasticus]|nr:hypothetical protein LTR15_009019 [Elasticomyces elasticus]
MYYEEVHAYIELDDAGDACRITFLVYHPEAHIIDSIPFAAREMCAELHRIYMSVISPAGPIEALKRNYIRKPWTWLSHLRRHLPLLLSAPPTENLTTTAASSSRKRIGTGSGSLDDFVVITRSDRPVDTSTKGLTPTALVDFVFSKCMLPEAQLGIQLTEEDVPTDLQPHLTFNLLFAFAYNLNECDLPFGKCALAAYLIARFDRQGIPLPKFLCRIPPDILAILRGPLLYPAQSVLVPVLLYALSQLGNVAKKRLTEKLSKTWTTMIWDEI